MKKPKLKEIREYFKDAAQIETPIFGKICFLADYDMSNLIQTFDGVFVENKKDKINVQLYSNEKGYAKILNTKP